MSESLMKRKAAGLLLALLALPALSQTLTEGLEQTYEVQASASSGHTPLWLNANRYGLSSLRSVNGYMRGRVERPLDVDSVKQFGFGYGLDLAVPLHYISHLVLQQCYAEARYKHGILTVGQKQWPMELKNNELSSGSHTLGINARPIPGVRFSVPDYWCVPGLNGWLALKGHLAFGWMTDSGFQEEWTDRASRYAVGVCYHSKAGYLRIGQANDDFPFSLELGLEMACEFGGKLYRTGRGVVEAKKGLMAYVDAFLASGDDEVDAVYKNVGGDHLGSWVARLNYVGDKVSAGLYADHYFEDHSAMFFLDYDGYGKGGEWDQRKENLFLLYPLQDILLGLEVKLHDVRWVDGIVLEFLNTRYQSGPIYHDHNPGISDHIGGVDNYYNHGLYPGWVHWGQVMGNPLYRSPIYNTDGTLLVEDNRFTAWHVGVSGSPLENLRYRLLASWQEGLGTYSSPFLEPQRNLSLLAEATYHLSGQGILGRSALRLGIGYDHGKLLGNNFGSQLTFIYKL